MLIVDRRFTHQSGSLTIKMSLVVGESEEEILSWTHAGTDLVPVK